MKKYICESCKSEVNDKQSFCGMCGSKLSDAKNELDYLKGMTLNVPGIGKIVAVKVEKTDKDTFIHSTDKKMYSLNKLIEKGFKLPEKSVTVRKKGSGRQSSGVITKREYESILKGAMKDAKSDGNEEHTYDMATSMIYDPEISAYLYFHYPMMNKRNLIQKLQEDLETFLQ